MKRFITLLGCVVVGLFLSVGCGPSSDVSPTESGAGVGKESLTLRIGAGHTPTSAQWIYVLENFFMAEVDRRLEATDYEIEWITAWGGSVARLGEVLEAVETNLLDIGYIVYVFEPTKLMLQGMTYRMPFQSGDPLLVSRAWHYMYEAHPEFKADFQKYNQTCLSVSVSDPYNMFSNFSIQSYQDLENVKVGAAGANLGWLENTGAVPVQTNLNEMYTSIQTGVYDGTIQPTGASYRLRVHEEAPYLLEAQFGVQGFGAIVINNDTLDGLPEEVRAIMEDVAVEYETEEAEYILERYEEDKAGLLAEGATIYTLPQEDREAWAAQLPNIVGELANELNGLGYPGTEIIQDYYRFLQDNGYEMIRAWDLN